MALRMMESMTVVLCTPPSAPVGFPSLIAILPTGWITQRMSVASQGLLL